ncbi:Component of a membrane-bound complex containing the Tor2p kinase [Blastocladiella emersonii ATCC 22665]|nr:Component of a membrane-bound complex containing the Tor2p kinase [Blastocladiella emersonii ATCC 22665]
MSLLLDRRFIIERLRLAVLSLEDSPCENVISLRVRRPASPTAGIPAFVAYPHDKIAASGADGSLSLTLQGIIRRGSDHASRWDDLIHDDTYAVFHDNSPPAAMLAMIPHHYQALRHAEDLMAAPGFAASPDRSDLSGTSVASSVASTAARASSPELHHPSDVPARRDSVSAVPFQPPVRRTSLYTPGVPSLGRTARNSQHAYPVPPIPDEEDADEPAAAEAPPMGSLATHAGHLPGGAPAPPLPSDAKRSSTGSTSAAHTHTPRNLVLSTSAGEDLEIEAELFGDETDSNSMLSPISERGTQGSSRRASAESVVTQLRVRAEAAGAAGSEPTGTIIQPPPRRASAGSINQQRPPTPLAPQGAATTKGPRKSLTGLMPVSTLPAIPSVESAPSGSSSPPATTRIAGQVFDATATSTTATPTPPAADEAEDPTDDVVLSESLSMTRSTIEPKVEPPARPQAPPSPLFVRKAVPPRPTGRSAPSGLSMLLGSKSAQQNPFAASYSRYAGKHAKDVVKLHIHVPYAETELDISVGKGTTVEQVIGYTLFEYVEQGLAPVIDPPRQELGHWAMRIVEDDGTIDEDFPALDRNRPIDRFQFDAFALCETAKLPPPPSPSDPAASAGSGSAATSNGMGTLRSTRGSTAGTGDESRPGYNGLPGDPNALGPLPAPIAATMGRNGTAAAGPGPRGDADSGMGDSQQQQQQQQKLFIRVHLYSTIEVRHTTTLNVAPTTPLGHILDAVCRKRNVSPRDYVLKLHDMRTVVPDLTKPFSSLGPVSELFLMKKSIGASAGDMFLRPPGEEESATPAERGAAGVGQFFGRTGLSAVSAYKKFTVVRKMPLFLGRQERVLAIDGEYLHILPTDNKQFFDSVKTSSYHVSSVISCKQSKKVAAVFRLEVLRNPHGERAVPSLSAVEAFTGSREGKTYDFEAGSAAEATEICTAIQTLIQSVRRAATMAAAAAGAPTSLAGL